MSFPTLVHFFSHRQSRWSGRLWPVHIIAFSIRRFLWNHSGQCESPLQFKLDKDHRTIDGNDRYCFSTATWLWQVAAAVASFSTFHRKANFQSELKRSRQQTGDSYTACLGTWWNGLLFATPETFPPLWQDAPQASPPLICKFKTLKG